MTTWSSGQIADVEARFRETVSRHAHLSACNGPWITALLERCTVAAGRSPQDRGPQACLLDLVRGSTRAGEHGDTRVARGAPVVVRGGLSDGPRVRITASACRRAVTHRRRRDCAESALQAWKIENEKHQHGGHGKKFTEDTASP